jgi:two-component system, OmpR family, phosphate regulon response regulator PhoB
MALELIEIIEDEPAHARLLQDALAKARFRTNVTADGSTGLEDIRRLNPALIVLDVMLAGMDGLEVCRRVREDPSIQAIPIVMLTALGSEDHRIAGLEIGVDDYVTKPFSPREVVARVKAVLRRVRPCDHAGESYLNGDLLLEETYHVVSFHGRRLHLSPPEWRLLHRLARQAGTVTTREELISLIWGDDDLIHEHELERIVKALNDTLSGNASHGKAILTVPGGYLIGSRSS